KMSLSSKLKLEGKGMLAASVFYAVVGVAFLVWMFLAGFPFHFAIIALFSLVSAYALIMKRGWAIWFVMICFFAATTLTAFIIYGCVTSNVLLGLGMVAYLVLTWVFTAYVANKRSSLQD
ncbi:hypothetical protein MUO56_04070, partial [Candidatus Bathyarchaeota archaeon]|nr:hypothetical protein [Candidatus Bathyarchaeota archaeon]